MSIFSSIIKTVGSIAKTGLGVAATVSGLPGIGKPPMMNILPALGGISRGLPALGMIGSKILPALGGLGKIAVGVAKNKWTRRAAEAAGYIVVGMSIFDAAGNRVGNVKRSRRINPLNAKALNRAMKRVCKAKDICKKVEKIASGTPKRRRAC